MENKSELDLVSALTDGFVRTLQVLHYAMTMAIISLAVVFFILIQSGQITSHGGSLPGILSLVHALSACSALPMGLILFNLILRNLDASDRISMVQQRIQAAYLTRLALFEGVAIFGLVAILLTGKEGLHAQPLYWINLSTCLIYVGLLLLTFPTRERLLYHLQNRFQR